jgi:type I restriction enzyme S subunit
MSATAITESDTVNNNSSTMMPMGFRQTEVGVVPEHWSVEACDKLCLKIQDGTHFSPKVSGGDYLYVTSRNIGFGTLDVSDVDTISETEHRKIYSRCDVRKGDLLITKDGANTGNTAINDLDEEISLLSSVAFLRFNPENDARFYLQYVLSHEGQERIKQLMSGNAITRLTLTKIRALKMPRPPACEQRAIATALADADALIRSWTGSPRRSARSCSPQPNGYSLVTSDCRHLQRRNHDPKTPR